MPDITDITKVVHRTSSCAMLMSLNRPGHSWLTQPKKYSFYYDDFPFAEHLFRAGYNQMVRALTIDRTLSLDRSSETLQQFDMTYLQIGHE